MLLNGLLIGFPLSSKAIHYPTTGSGSHRCPAGRAVPSHVTVTWGKGAGVTFAFTSLFNPLTYILHGLQVLRPHWTLKGSRRVQFSMQLSRPSKGWGHSRPSACIWLGKSILSQYQASACCTVRSLPGSMDTWSLSRRNMKTQLPPEKDTDG